MRSFRRFLCGGVRPRAAAKAAAKAAATAAATAMPKTTTTAAKAKAATANTTAAIAMAAAIAVAATATSCLSMMQNDDADAGTGTISIHFQSDLTDTKARSGLDGDNEMQTDTKAQSGPDGTKARSMPDTDDFLIKVESSDGKVLYSGTFGAAPESIIAAAGTYTVSAVSCEFNEPMFDKPQYGDTQVAVVKSGQTTDIELECTQQNCGITLDISPDFLTSYPDGVLYLKSTEGKLMYGYSETRAAYFKPGAISLVLNQGSTDRTLCTRTLEARQMLRLGITVSSDATDSKTSGGISIKVDTTRDHISDNYIMGENNAGGDEIANALSVSRARLRAPENDVWVYGYVVGGDLTSSNCSFEAPFSSRTNLVIAEKSSCTDKSSCLSVQLSKGDTRDALNLVDNPGLLGTKIFLKGDLVEAYYGIPGIQSISEFKTN